jgi:hypothetical protein
MQLVIHQRNQLLERAVVTAAPHAEQAGEITFGGLILRFHRVSLPKRSANIKFPSAVCPAKKRGT